jgi:tetratricopeptide (TPR) repeat protein
MSDLYSNAARADLLAALKDPEKVVFIVGTGATFAATGQELARWDGLILDGLNQVAKEKPGREKWLERNLEELNEATKDATDGLRRLLALATQVESELDAPKDGRWRRWLESVSKRLEADAASKSQHPIHAALKRFGLPLVATTNYDTLLTTALRHEAIPWTRVADVDAALRGKRSCVLHLHGTWAAPESVVFGNASYARLKQDAAAKSTLDALFRSKTLVFVGCGTGGLNDPHFEPFWDWVHDTFRGISHQNFVLCRDSEVASCVKAFPSGSKNHATPYGAKHDDLPQFLHKLADDLKLPGAVAEAPIPTPLAPTTTSMDPDAGGPFKSFLPAPEDMVGRDADLAAIVAEWSSEKAKPVLVLGGPGMGKSTLILNALHDPSIATKYGNRRAFVRCDGATSSEALAQQVALAIGLTPGPNSKGDVIYAAGQAPCALVLDNIENAYASDKDRVAEWLSLLAGQASIRLGVTLRGNEQPLRISWRVVGLNPLAPAQATQAFLRHQPRFGTDPDLDRFIALAEGLPLALMLMRHAVAGDDSLAFFLSRWPEEGTSALALENTDDRSASIDRCLLVSLELPTLKTPNGERGKEMFQVLCTLPDGLAFPIAKDVIDNQHGKLFKVLSGLGLAYIEGERYRVLAPLRDAGARLLSMTDQMEGRVWDAYCKLALRGSELGRANGGRAVAAITPEAGNIDAWLVRLANAPPPGLVAAAFRFADFARFTGATGRGLIKLTEPERLPDGKPRAALLWALGAIALARSDLTIARLHNESSLRICTDNNDTLGAANCIHSLGTLASHRSDHSTAKRHFEAALSLFKKARSINGAANCIRSLGEIARQRLELTDAYNLSISAKSLYQKAGDAIGEANCVWSLGTIAFRRLDLNAASRQYRTAQTSFRQIGDLIGDALCYMGMGDVARKSGYWDTALNSYQHARLWSARVGSKHGLADVHIKFGLLDLIRLHSTEAHVHFQQALGTFKAIDVPGSIGWAHVLLAKVSDGAERDEHLAEARRQWASVNRDDLLAKLDEGIDAVIEYVDGPQFIPASGTSVGQPRADT